MKKRMINFVIGILIIAVMAGCGTEEVNDTETEESLSEQVTEVYQEAEQRVDYIKSLGVSKSGYILSTTDNDNTNNFGEYSHVTYETGFCNEVNSGTIWIEEWYRGNCVKSIPAILSPEAEEIFIVMDVAMTGSTRVMIATDEYDGTWEQNFPFPFEADLVEDRHFFAYEAGYESKLEGGEERILSMVVFDMGNGAEGYSCDLLLSEPQKLEETDYLLLVRAAFDEEGYELTEKAPGGVHPTNVFRLDEMVTIEDVTRKNAYSKALEDILYKHVSPTEEALVEWTMGQNSYSIMDVNSDGKEELLIKHESVMADTKLCIYGYNEDTQSLQVLYCTYPEVSLYDNGVMIAEASHNQSESEFWPYTLWMPNEMSGTYEEVVRVDNVKQDIEVREQYIGDAEIVEILFERLPYTMPNGAA